jgi:hypothetical protein
MKIKYFPDTVTALVEFSDHEVSETIARARPQAADPLSI